MPLWQVWFSTTVNSGLLPNKQDHAKQLRNILRLHYPKNISNAEQHARTKIDPWNTTIRRKHMN